MSALVFIIVAAVVIFVVLLGVNYGIFLHEEKEVPKRPAVSIPKGADEKDLKQQQPINHSAGLKPNNQTQQPYRKTKDNLDIKYREAIKSFSSSPAAADENDNSRQKPDTAYRSALRSMQKQSKDK